ncbi:MAG: dual OB domain-containing protein [Gammaproteobacteria bacterium]
MDVLIVSRTVMGARRCIGGVCVDTLDSVRLLREDGNNQYYDSLYQIGQVWQLNASRVIDPRAPHVEDLLVKGGRMIHDGVSISNSVDANWDALSRAGRCWDRELGQTFGGNLGFTGNGSGYINEHHMPSVSTGFWKADRPLSRADDSKKVRFAYGKAWLRRLITYVGDAPAPTAIPRGSLCRLSLARWWSPENSDMEERCYLQLSGVYPPGFSARMQPA